MTSLLGHEFRKQALHRLYRISGNGCIKTAPTFTRERMNAALRRFNTLALTN